MVKIHILVEGQTEEEFTRGILYEYLHPKGIFINPIIAKTRRAIGGNPAYRGGIVSYEKIEFDLKRLVHDTSASLITTMIDYYQLPSDFPGFDDEGAKKGSPLERVKYLETKFGESINHRNFWPYISTHEFEALLFSSPDVIVQEVRGEDPKVQKELQAVLKKYNNPEEINKDDPPSKRILKYLSEYDKIAHGNLIAIEVGIVKMRKYCPHFNEWLNKIELLGSS
jgi:Domain of unknown function (DUF4276)